MKRGRIIYSIIAMALFSTWILAEFNAWGGSGRRSNVKLSPTEVHQVRSGTPGAVSFLYFSHGYRGK